MISKYKSAAYLSRALQNKIEEPECYEFYSGPGPLFSSNVKNQNFILEEVYGQISVAWNDYLKKYIMATSSDISMPRTIQLYSSIKPWGPWVSFGKLNVPKTAQGKEVNLVYCAYLHPELFLEEGKIINVTYSLQLEDAGFDANCEMVNIILKKI